MQHDAACIYVVSCGPHIKLGVSRNLNGRLRALQVGQAFPVKLECLWDVPADRAFKAEACAKRLLAKFRVRGEWFSASLDDIREIEPQVFRRAYRGAIFDPAEYSAPDTYPVSIMAQGRFLTLGEQAAYSKMLDAQLSENIG